MIWRIPFAVSLTVLHLARCVSWVVLPRALHDRFWGRDLCRWNMHAWEETGRSGIWGWWVKCKHCKRERFESVIP